MQGSLGLLLHLCGLRCVFLTGPHGPSCLDLPVYTSVCLNLELSLSLGLLVLLLRACLDLPFCPSVCLLGVWGPLPPWSLTHSAGWARPHGHVHILLRLWTGVHGVPAQLLPARLPDPADEPTGNPRAFSLATRGSGPLTPDPPTARPTESPYESPVCQFFSHIPGRRKISPNSSKSLARLISNFRNVHTTKLHCAFLGTWEVMQLLARGAWLSERGPSTWRGPCRGSPQTVSHLEEPGASGE